MRSYGNAGRGASNHERDPSLLSGVTLAAGSEVVYPDNRCRECERSGVPLTDAECHRRHWRPLQGDRVTPSAGSVTTSS